MVTNNVESASPRIFHGLDGLRAYSALGIVIMHVLANMPVKPTENILTKPNGIIPFFAQLVFLFMMMSAFSMCCGYYERFKNNNISLNEFYKKRYQRILPFFALLTIIDLTYTRTVSSLYEAFANLTLCFNLLPNPDISVIGVGWFLGTIFLFYLLFPFFVFLIDNKKRAWFVFFIVIVFHLIARVYFFSDEFIVNIFYDGWANMINCAPYFVLGGIVYLYRYSLFNVVNKNNIISGIICLLSTFVFFCYQNYFSSIGMALFSKLLLFFIWIIYALSIYSLFLQNRLTKYLSGISLEIYLSHMLLYRVIEKLNIEDFVNQIDLLYIIVSSLTVLATIMFSHVVKYWLLPRMSKALIYMS